MVELVLLLLQQLRLARLILRLLKADRKHNLPTQIVRLCMFRLLKADRKRNLPTRIVRLCIRLLLKANRIHSLQIRPNLPGIRLRRLVQKAIQALHLPRQVVLLQVGVQEEAVGIDLNNAA